jgi:hypothetical protein
MEHGTDTDSMARLLGGGLDYICLDALQFGIIHERGRSFLSGEVCNVYYIFIVLYLFTTSHSTRTPLLED